jgi:hypothetical protein
MHFWMQDFFRMPPISQAACRSSRLAPQNGRSNAFYSGTIRQPALWQVRALAADDLRRRENLASASRCGSALARRGRSCRRRSIAQGVAGVPNRGGAGRAAMP